MTQILMLIFDIMHTSVQQFDTMQHCCFIYNYKSYLHMFNYNHIQNQ